MRSAVVPCKGLTDFETTYVDPEGLEPFRISGSLSAKYTCKILKGDKPVNYHALRRFGPF
jgi:hypothetical protein